jgi:small conductance mechanosensitive channel
MTKDFAFAVINVGVSYSSNLDHVMDVMRSIGDELQKDPVFKRVILEPLEMQGVDKLGDSSITISARLRTRPGKQWDVRRQFLLKLVQRFEKEGIEIPFPTVANIQKPVA